MSDPEMLRKQIKLIIKHLNEAGNERGKMVSVLRKLDEQPLQQLPNYLRESFKDEFLFQIVEPEVLNGISVAGVDGGLVTTSLVSLDLIMIRAISVIFHYSANGIKQIDYVPSKHPGVEFFPSDSIHGYSEFETFSGYQRVIKELEVANQVLKSYREHVDILYMDGALNLGKFRPGLEKYQARIKLLTGELLENARKRGSTVAWCVKDSRTSYFLEFFGELVPKVARHIPEILNLDYRSILKSSRDQHFMGIFLPVNSRSFLLKRTTGVDEIMEEIEKEMYSFYLKPTAYDVPFRIDFAMPRGVPDNYISNTAEKIASVTLPLSRIHEGYSVPVPIIEADARARINQKEFQALVSSIRKRIFALDTLALKRERSPFSFI
ncbi:MAG: DNA double-strand break repair nuclease NurA [Candidatus Odinarchaeota archaeon]